ARRIHLLDLISIGTWRSKHYRLSGTHDQFLRRWSLHLVFAESKSRPLEQGQTNKTAVGGKARQLTRVMVAIVSISYTIPGSSNTRLPASRARDLFLKARTDSTVLGRGLGT